MICSGMREIPSLPLPSPPHTIPHKLWFTVEPQFNKPLINEVLDITNNILCPGQSYSKMYGIEPRYNEPRFNEFFDITNIIRKPKRKIYLDITNYNVNTRQKINAEQINALKVSFFCKQKLRVYSKVKIIATESYHALVNELHLKTRHFWVTKIGLNCVTEVTCVENQSLTMTSI